MNMKSIAHEANEAIELLNSMIEYIEDENDETRKELGITEEFCNHLAGMTEEDIQSIDYDGIDKLFEMFGGEKEEILQKFSNDGSDKSAIEKWRDIFLNIHRSYKSLIDAKKNKSELLEDVEKIAKKQTEFLNSAEYIEKFNEAVENLRKKVDSEQDERLRKEYEKKLDAIRKTSNISFISDRLKRYGDKEVKSLVDAFFDKQKGNHIIKKYKSKINKLGLSGAFHMSLYNFEEKFLPETYYPFNNFFLFNVMRFIGYADLDNETEKLYVSALIASLNSLVSEDIDENRKTELLREIRSFYSYFDNDSIIESFMKKNRLWKNHPHRIELEKKIAEKKAERAAKKKEDDTSIQESNQII